MKFRVDVLEGAKIAALSLRTNRMRTILTTVGMGIGVATLLAIVGIIQGLNGSFARQLATLGSTTLVVSKWPWIIKNNWWEYRNRKELTPEVGYAITGESAYATTVAPAVNRQSDVSFLGTQLSNVNITGTTAEYLPITSYVLDLGRFISDAEAWSETNVAVIGQDVVEGLFPHSMPLDASIKIDNKPFRVIGTLLRRGQILGESQDLRVFIPYKTFRAYFGKQRSMSLVVGIDRPDHLNAAEDELTGIVRRARRTPPDKPDDFTINRPDQLAETYRQLTGALYGVAVGVGLITLLVGGIGIMNIMLVSVRERTREIGIRRALGARKQTIVLQFLMEAATVSSIGGALGTLVGLLSAKLISEVTPLAAAIQPLTIVGGVAFASLVGLIFGIWPAARASNLDPVEALRYE